MTCFLLPILVWRLYFWYGVSESCKKRLIIAAYILDLGVYQNRDLHQWVLLCLAPSSLCPQVSKSLGVS